MTPRKPVTDWTTDWDHLDPRWREDPFPIWDELRRSCPIAHTERYQGAYLPTRYEDVRAIANDSTHFSSRRVIVREVRPEPIPSPPITAMREAAIASYPWSAYRTDFPLRFAGGVDGNNLGGAESGSR